MKGHIYDKKQIHYSTFTMSEAFANSSGPVPYTLTNDYLFRAVFQSTPNALKGLVCSLLHFNPQEIHSLEISNPIDIGKSISDKEIVLDIKLILNDHTIINLEMQVNNEHNWTDRSLVYTCRTFGSLNKGNTYTNVKPVIHIGFLDFELFPEHPEFYATYQILNVKNCHKYSDKITVSVVNLNRTDLATEEDKSYDIDYWARLFKSTTWEDIKMLAAKNSSLLEAANAMYDFTSDEIIREHCEMREEFRRRARTQEIYMEELKANAARIIEESDKIKKESYKIKKENNNIKKENNKIKIENNKAKQELLNTKEHLNKTTAQLNDTTTKLNDTTAQLNDTTAQLNYANLKITEQSQELASLRAEIEALKKH